MTFEGEVQQLDLMAKLVELWREKFTGALRFENDAVIKIVYFKQGNVISASTNDRADSIDEVLVRAGKVNKEHVRQALSKRKESETLGDALLGLGFITKKELAWARRVQLVGVVRSILDWKQGNFTIVANYLPKREEGTIFYVPQIVLELVVTDQDREKFVKGLDDGNVVFEKSDDFDADYPFLGLNEDADRIVELIDGTRSATDIGASSAMDSFNVFKLLHALRSLGLIRTGKPQEEPDVFPQSENAFDFQLDDAPAADADWTIPAADSAIPAEPRLEIADVADSTGAEEWSAPAAPASAEDDVSFESSSSAPAEEWATPAEEEPAAEIAASPVPSTGAAAAAGSAFSLSVDPDILGRTAGGDPEYDRIAPETTSLESPASEKLSTTWPRPQQRPQLATAPTRRSKSPMLMAGAAVLVIAILGAGWFFFMREGSETEPEAAVAVTTPRPAAMEQAPAGAPATETTSSASVMPEAVPMETAAPVSSPAQPRPTATSSAAGTVSVRIPPSASPADATRARYEQMAAEYARNANPAEFTVQFQLVCQTDSVTRALREGGASVWFAPVAFKGKTCFRVFWGHYSTRAAADAAIGQIPASLRAGSKAATIGVSGVVK